MGSLLGTGGVDRRRVAVFAGGGSAIVVRSDSVSGFAVEGVFGNVVRGAIAGFLHPLVEELFHVLPGDGVGGIVGEVVELMGIGVDVVEFGYRTGCEEDVGLSLAECVGIPERL